MCLTKWCSHWVLQDKWMLVSQIGWEGKAWGRKECSQQRNSMCKAERRPISGMNWKLGTVTGDTARRQLMRDLGGPLFGSYSKDHREPQKGFKQRGTHQNNIFKKPLCCLLGSGLDSCSCQVGDDGGLEQAGGSRGREQQRRSRGSGGSQSPSIIPSQTFMITRLPSESS